LVAGDEQWPVRLRNISSGGAMVESRRPLAAGREVELDLGDQLRLMAIVRWSHDDRIGLQFAETFDLARMGRVRREAPEVRMLTPEYLREPAPKPGLKAIRDIRSR
jgi:hypothetical protein